MTTKQIAFFLAMLASTSASVAAERALTHVTGDVYRFQSDHTYGLVISTEDGFVIADPIDAETATWLKTELKAISAKPVTHLIFSHSHLDHAAGGGVFAESATVIAQLKAPDRIDGVPIDIKFSEELLLKAGEKTIELTYLGEGHGVDLIALVVRPENVAYISDTVKVKRLPYAELPGSDADGWINQIRKAETLNFDILAPGHGPLGRKADMVDHRQYMELLRDRVGKALEEGKTEAETVEEVRMEEFSDWQAYDEFRKLNVIGMRRILSEKQKTEISR